MLKYRKIFCWNGKLHLLSEPREQRNKQQGGSTMAKARERERGWSQPKLLSIRGLLCLSGHHHRKQPEPWDGKGGLHRAEQRPTALDADPKASRGSWGQRVLRAATPSPSRLITSFLTWFVLQNHCKHYYYYHYFPLNLR